MVRSFREMTLSPAKGSLVTSAPLAVRPVSVRA